MPHPSEPKDPKKQSLPKGEREIFDGNIDLSGLNLKDLTIEPLSPPVPVFTWFTRIIWISLLVALTVLLLWVPNVLPLYGIAGDFTFVLSSAAAILGLFIGKLLYQWALEDIANDASLLKTSSNKENNKSTEEDAYRNVPAWIRNGILAILIVGGGIIAYLRQKSAIDTGHGAYTSGWFFLSISAVILGILLGRWLMMQAAQPLEGVQRKAEVTWKFPPWFKWLSLAVLISAACIALWMGRGWQNTGSGGFFTSLIGFIVGTLLAIWLVRRFDEEEQRYRRQRRE